MIYTVDAVETTRTSPDIYRDTPRGRPILIILERDGSLHHYPPERAQITSRQALVNLNEEQTEPKLIDKVLTFALDVLGVNNLELRINEQQKS